MSIPGCHLSTGKASARNASKARVYVQSATSIQQQKACADTTLRRYIQNFFPAQGSKEQGVSSLETERINSRFEGYTRETGRWLPCRVQPKESEEDEAATSF